MTEKLYYKDSFIHSFTAKVRAVTDKKGSAALLLDRTAFFPGGGGQDADEGTLAGRAVKGVEESEGEIYHLVDDASGILPGDEIEGRLHWALRFERMQQHSGEHVLSGVMHREYGAQNVGFHLGNELTRLDFHLPLSEEQIRRAETLANESVFQNIPVCAGLYGREQAAGKEYRSKIDIPGEVRIVEIEGVDSCACCAPHLRTTGEIGLIKIVSWEPYKGGMRLHIACGGRALSYARFLSGQAEEISHLLAAKTDSLARAVGVFRANYDGMRTMNARLQKALRELKAAGAEEAAGDAVVFEGLLTGDALREYANALAQKTGGALFLFSGEEGKYDYILTSQSEDVRPFAKLLNARFLGKGGGSAEMCRGSLAGSPEEIEGYIKNLRE